jgi:hypothetical protein
MTKILPAFIFILLFYSSTYAQSPADSTSKHSPVKTLSGKQYDALLKGEDIYNMELVAELNHYPAPDKVIKFKKELGLSPLQITRLNEINTGLHRKKMEMGAAIIHNERALDSLFRIKQLSDGVIIFYTNRYGLYQGELRNAILQACFTTRKILTQGQITKFERLQNHD